MNTHDIDIELPPLPWKPAYEHHGSTLVVRLEDVEDAMRAAIAADRRRQGDAAKVLAELAALIPLADTLNASESCQDLIDYFKGVIADRKRRGKPVAWEHRFRALPDGQWTAWGPGKAPTLRTDSYEVQERALYTAPQPAEPVKCIGCEGKPAPENNPCAVCGKEAEPVNTDSAGYTLGPVSDGGMDPRNAPAEPVKVPSDAEIEALAKEYMFAHAQFVGAGEVWCEGEVEFARALLARYGQPSDPAKAPSADPFAAERKDWERMQDADGSTEYAVHHQGRGARRRT